jgi:hypothetical protein
MEAQVMHNLVIAEVRRQPDGCLEVAQRQGNGGGTRQQRVRRPEARAQFQHAARPRHGLHDRPEGMGGLHRHVGKAMLSHRRAPW